MRKTSLATSAKAEYLLSLSGVAVDCCDVVACLDGVTGGVKNFLASSLAAGKKKKRKYYIPSSSAPNLHRFSMPRVICSRHCAILLVFKKNYKCLFIPNCTRKVMWLLITWKDSRWFSRSKRTSITQSRKNCAIQATRPHARLVLDFKTNNLIGSCQTLLFISQSKARILWVNCNEFLKLFFAPCLQKSALLSAN